MFNVSSTFLFTQQISHLAFVPLLKWTTIFGVSFQPHCLYQQWYIITPLVWCEVSQWKVYYQTFFGHNPNTMCSFLFFSLSFSVFVFSQHSEDNVAGLTYISFYHTPSCPRPKCLHWTLHFQGSRSETPISAYSYRLRFSALFHMLNLYICEWRQIVFLLLCSLLFGFVNDFWMFFNIQSFLDVKSTWQLPYN